MRRDHGGARAQRSERVGTHGGRHEAPREASEDLLADTLILDVEPPDL